MKMEDLENHIKNAFDKSKSANVEQVKALMAQGVDMMSAIRQAYPNYSEEEVQNFAASMSKPANVESTKEASSKELDLFGYPVEKEESFDKKALKVEKDEDSPKKMSQPDCEESFSATNQNKKGEEPEAGDDIGETSDPHVQGTGEGPEY
tara:strand:+ start:22532 stop:22981 length:450 start_codon:yes stop_codon:yes gene_type:complete